MLVLGLDAGGTKTVGYLADEHGAVLAKSRGPGANLRAVGEQGLEAILRQVIDDALGRRGGELGALCLGIAGVDRPEEHAAVRRVLAQIVTPPHVLVVNDALVALEAGAPNQPGIVIISGTGSIAYGRDERGRIARAGGWGHVLADEGSGYWLGRQALRAVMRDADGRGPATSLTRRLLAHYSATRAEDLVREVYAGDLKPSAIATLAADVEAAAGDGDAVAEIIITAGATELATAALSVARQLDLTACPVVLAGGIFSAVPRMRAALTTLLREALPQARVEPLGVEPALGAVHLACRALAGPSAARS